MTAPLDLVPIRALAAAATKGPWEAKNSRIQGPHVRGGDGSCVADLFHKEDAEFISASRALVPQLCDEIERLRALLAEAKFHLNPDRARSESLAEEIEEALK